MEPFEMDDDCLPHLVPLTAEIVMAIVALCESHETDIPDEDNPYQQAARVVRAWIEKHIDFTDDDEPANPVQFNNTDPEF